MHHGELNACVFVDSSHFFVAYLMMQDVWAKPASSPRQAQSRTMGSPFLSGPSSRQIQHTAPLWIFIGIIDNVIRGRGSFRRPRVDRRLAGEAVRGYHKILNGIEWTDAHLPEWHDTRF